MLITREADYAMRILRALLEGRQLTVGTLAEQEQVPQPFAYKILKKLATADWVSIARGADGGVTLTANLKTVSLFDLLAVLEQNMAVSACMERGYACSWREAHDCAACTIHTQLTAIQHTLDAALQRDSLYEIFSRT